MKTISLKLKKPRVLSAVGEPWQPWQVTIYKILPMLRLQLECPDTHGMSRVGWSGTRWEHRINRAHDGSDRGFLSTFCAKEFHYNLPDGNLANHLLRPSHAHPMHIPSVSKCIFGQATSDFWIAMDIGHFLVVWNMFHFYIRDVIIPTDFQMFQRGRVQPATSY